MNRFLLGRSRFNVGLTALLAALVVYGCGEEPPKRIEDVAQGYSITLPDKWEERRYSVGDGQYDYYLVPRNQRRMRRHERLSVGRRENLNNIPTILEDDWTESDGYFYYDYVWKRDSPEDSTSYNRLIFCGGNWFHIMYNTFDSSLDQKDTIVLSDLPDSVIRSIQSFKCSSGGIEKPPETVNNTTNTGHISSDDK